MANIAVIGPSINIRISAKAPMDYVAKYKISDEKLRQQFIEPKFTGIAAAKFEDWVFLRAEKLAKEANSFLAELKSAK